MSDSYSYTRYLRAKVTVDDRSLNQHVLSALRSTLDTTRSLKVIEVGAGIGTMVARLADWGVLKAADYTLVDVDGESLAFAADWLTQWAAARNRNVEAGDGALRIRGGEPNVDLLVRFLCREVREVVDDHALVARADLVIANAFLDLVELPVTLGRLLRVVEPSGLYWFTINFDGETIFQPEHPLDRTLLEAYHQSMDERVRRGRPAGDRYTGRRLFEHLRSVGAGIIAAGSSDWVVHARNGRYVADESYFVDCILHSIDKELNWRAEVDQAGLGGWLAARRAQLTQGDLVYIAHQMDFFGRASLNGHGAATS